MTWLRDNWERLAMVSMAIAMLGMLPLVLVAAIFGAEAPVTYAFGLLAFGPFFIFAGGYIMALWAKLLVDTWKGKEQ